MTRGKLLSVLGLHLFICQMGTRTVLTSSGRVKIKQNDGGELPGMRLALQKRCLSQLDLMTAQRHSLPAYVPIWRCFFPVLPSNFLSSSQLPLSGMAPKFYDSSVLTYFLIAFVLQPRLWRVSSVLSAGASLIPHVLIPRLMRSNLLRRNYDTLLPDKSYVDDSVIAQVFSGTIRPARN